MTLLRILAVALLLTLSSCAPAPLSPIRTGEPIGVQLMRIDPTVVGSPFRVLLDFESDTDTAFLSATPAAHIDHEVAHTGAASLQATSKFAVKLGALLPPTGFPGTWALVGGYFISKEPARIQATYELEGKVLAKRTINLEPRKWSPVLLDVTPLSDPNQSPTQAIGVLRFEITGGPVWCDDVILIDNSRELVPASEPAGSTWTVRQRGFETTIERQGAFRLTLPTPEAAPTTGWRIDESSELRVRLTSADGRHARTIYADGRQYDDTKLGYLVKVQPPFAAEYSAEHASPAEIQVREELGRLNRNTPGDRNNDGYNETTGSYQLKANGPRIELTVIPHTPRLVDPVLEVAGLPNGKVQVNVDGQVVNRWGRLPDGHVLVEIPGTIERAVGVSLSVR